MYQHAFDARIKRLSAFVDDPQPDETLFSIMTRYHLLSANPSMMHTLADLYDRKAIRAPTQPLPARMGELAARIPKENPLSDLDYLALHHSSLAYHMCFFTDEARLAVSRTLHTTGTQGLGTALGMTYSPVGRAATNLAWCPVCVEEDRRSLGYAYWRVSHQLPLVTVCHDHNEKLIVGCKHCGLSVPNDFRFVLPGTHLPGCESFDPTHRRSSQSSELEHWIAVESHRASIRSREGLAISSPRSIYEALKAKGLGKSGGIDGDKVMATLLQRFGTSGLLHLTGSLAIGPQLKQSLCSIYRSSAERPNTMRVLVLSTILAPTVSGLTLLGRVPDVAHLSQWRGELPGLLDRLKTVTAVAKHLGINWYTVSREVSLQGLARDKSRVRPRLPSDKKGEITRMLADGVAIRDISRRLKSSGATIGRILEETPSLKRERAEAIEDRIRSANRDHILKLKKEMPNAGRRAINKKAGSQCLWLRQHDAAWLDEQLPSARRTGLQAQPKGPPRSRDWNAFDIEQSLKLPAAVKGLLARQVRPKWVSRAHVLKAMGIRGKNGRVDSQQLPLLRAELAKHTESREQFQVRLLKWSVEELGRKRVAISLTQINKISHLGWAVICHHRKAIHQLAVEKGLTMPDPPAD